MPNLFVRRLSAAVRSPVFGASPSLREKGNERPAAESGVDKLRRKRTITEASFADLLRRESNRELALPITRHSRYRRIIRASIVVCSSALPVDLSHLPIAAQGKTGVNQ